MRPSYVVVVDAFPHTPNGKIRKVGLVDAFELSTDDTARLWADRP